MADTVSFKVFLTKEDDPIDARPEVRRFGIDRDVVSNFVYLSEKLQSVFAALRSRRFTISWKDTDGDDVVISSDEELKIALSETESQNVRVLHVTLHSEYPSDNFTSDKEPVTQTIHSGVICDACDKEIQGFRYKCIQCPDFDLCTDCEGKGLHPEHCMIRSATPIQWKPHFGRRIAHHMNKFARKNGHGSGKEGDGVECPQKRGKFHGGYHGGNHGGHHGESHGKFSERLSWLDTLTAYLNEWAHLPQEGECPMRNRAAHQNNGDSETDKDKNGCRKEKPRVDIPAEFLKDIGQNLANLLDPLGINVQVTPESPNAPGTSSADNNASSQPDTTPQKFPGEGKKLVENPPPASNPAPSAPVNEDSTHKLTMEHDGWTLLNEQENSPKPSVVNPSPFQKKPAGPIKLPNFGFFPPPTVVSSSAFGPPPTSVPTTSGSDLPPTSEPTNPGFGVVPTSGLTNPGFGVLPSSGLTNPGFGVVPSSGLTNPGFGVVPSSGLTNPGFGVVPTSVPAAVITASPTYPELPKQAEIEQLTYHHDPKIQRAIVAMMQMGFSNDGGWLTHLLVSKDGDISKVLDVLQPVRLH